MRNLVIVLLSLCTTALHAQNDNDIENDFTIWDTDDDGYITTDEFDHNWDNETFYEVWDLDRNNELSEEEWNAGVENFYRETLNWEENEYRDFTNWDTNEDGRLGENEFRDGHFNTWDEDRDGQVNEAEFYNYSNTMAGDRRY